MSNGIHSQRAIHLSKGLHSQACLQWMWPHGYVLSGQWDVGGNMWNLQEGHVNRAWLRQCQGASSWGIRWQPGDSQAWISNHHTGPGLSACSLTAVLIWAQEQCYSFRSRNGRRAGFQLRKDLKNTKSRESFCKWPLISIAGLIHI